MESLLINAIIGFWLIAFGAMAIFPLLIDLRSEATPRQALAEDQIISIEPVAIRHHVTSIEQLVNIEEPAAAGTPKSTHPIHRHAA